MDISMQRIADAHRERGLLARTVGREDRLVRGCVAFSFLLLGGFGLLSSGATGFVSVVFLVLAAYFAVTAILAWDPVYAYAGMDTRTDGEVTDVELTADADDDLALDLDLTDEVIDVRDDAHEASALQG